MSNAVIQKVSFHTCPILHSAWRQEAALKPSPLQHTLMGISKMQVAIEFKLSSDKQH